MGAVAYRVCQRTFDFAADAASRAHPLLKWAGGKTSLLPVLRKLVPSGFRRYIEPFLGGGALFFDLCPPQAVLSDANQELMNCYEAVRNSPEAVVAALEGFHIDAEEFYRVRALDPLSLSQVDRAARLIFLNKTCYNGLYRVNREGRFNTPYGHHKPVRLVDVRNLFRASEALKRARLIHGSYRRVLEKEARAGDFVYLDPPYLPISDYSDFNRYTADQFREGDHHTLAKVFHLLAGRGCSVMASNSKHPIVMELFKGYRFTEVVAPRFINCRGAQRGVVAEVVVTNY